MSYQTPTIVTIPNPVSLDKAIAQIQTGLGTLDFIQYIFGRAWMMQTDLGEVPKVFTGRTIGNKDADYDEVMPNDEWNSYSFFWPNNRETPGGVDGYRPIRGANNTFTRSMSFVWWGRLPKVDEMQGQDRNYIYLEELKNSVYNVFKRNRLIVTGYEDESTKVFGGKLQDSEGKNLRYPNMAFEITFNLSYDEGGNCV